MSHNVTFDEDCFPMLRNPSPDLDSSTSLTRNVKVTFLEEDEEDEDSPVTITDVNKAQDSIEKVGPDQIEVTTHDDSTGREELAGDSSRPSPHVSLKSLDATNGRSQMPQARTSGRLRGKQVPYRGMCNAAEVFEGRKPFDCLPEAFSTASIPDVNEVPKSLKSARLMYDGAKWMKACEKEMKSLSNKKVWILVERPSHQEVI